MIAPAFFKHADLYDAEVSSGFPLRVAFAGLWTVADRRGVFPWSRNVKPDVLPYDGCDMLAVLEALAAGGFVRKYEVDGKWYGVVPTLGKHQHFHKDEKPNTLPAPPEPGADNGAGDGGGNSGSTGLALGKHRARTGQAPGQRAKSTEANGRLSTSDIRLANSKEHQPSHQPPQQPERPPPLTRAPKPPAPGKDAFDLAPYLAAHASRFPGSIVSAGRLGKALKPLEAQHGAVETLARWKVFLAEKGELGPEYFARTWSEWGPRSPGSPSASPANGAHAIARVPAATEMLIE